MRQLLNTLFVLSEDAYLSVNGENVIISREQKEVARFPLHTLEGILCFSYAGASPALMGACVQRGVDIAFFLPARAVFGTHRRRRAWQRPPAANAEPRVR